MAIKNIMWKKLLLKVIRIYTQILYAQSIFLSWESIIISVYYEIKPIFFETNADQNLGTGAFGSRFKNNKLFHASQDSETYPKMNKLSKFASMNL